MATLYCIPGMGTDERVFSKLVPLLQPQQECLVLKHLEPLSRQESIGAYAQRLLEQLPPPQMQPLVLLGLSLGGPIALEIAKKRSDVVVIFLSTFKQSKEEPFLFKLARIVPLYRLIPAWFTKYCMPPLARLLQIGGREDSALLGDMFASYTPAHFAWGRHAIVHWKNEALPTTCWHINGDKDHIFKSATPFADYCIVGGTHNMVLDRAADIAFHVRSILHEITASEDKFC